MNMRQTLAKTVRILTVPPIMISGLILILYAYRREFFRSFNDAVIAVILLGVVPVLAYPVHEYIPKLKKSGREGQRKLAFIFNIIGYGSAFIWSILSYAHAGLFLVCSTYWFSVVILTICNIFHFRASGHASSFTGPTLILLSVFGYAVVLPCIIMAGIVVWSSIELKRHTPMQLVGGIIACLVAFIISLGIVYLLW